MTKLKRTLRLAEVIFFATGVILGAGIYAVIGKAAGAAGNMLWLSFLLAALAAMLSLFAYAELSALYPSSGGEFAFVKEAAGLRLAYVVGSFVALSGIVSSATIAIAFSGYFGEVADVPGKAAALAIIGFILLVNISGIRNSSVVNIIFTVLETSGLLFVIYTAAPSVGSIEYLELPESGIHGLFVGAAICFFAFTGFEDAVKLAEETREPEKNIPRGLFIAGIIITCIYFTVALVVVSMIPFRELAASDSPLSMIVEKKFGQAGAITIAVVALFSTSNSLLSNMLGSSRVLYNFGKESKRLRALSYLLPGRRTPLTGLLIVAGVAAVCALFGEIRQVALITNFFMFLTFILINATVIYLRVKHKNLERPFRIPGNIRNIPVISVLAILLLLVLVSYSVYGIFTGTVAE